MALINRLPCNLINIQSTRNKTNKIRNLIVDKNLDICMMMETWLSGNVSDNLKINELKTVLFSWSYNKNEMNEINN